MRYLQFPALASLTDFFHGVFLRTALDSEGRIKSFNIGINCPDPEPVVQRNRKRMLTCFGQPAGVYARQVHGTEVGVLIRTGPEQSQGDIRISGDALVTARRDSALVIQVADCQPVVIADPVAKVVANVHSGWRGSISDVIGRTIKTLTTGFGCRPQNMVAGIGPSLGPCCAEFVNYRQEIPDRYWQYRQSGDRFDFWQLSIDQLTRAGVPLSAISVAGMCTKCNQHLFFSYRGQRQTGRFASVIGIR
jgi:YfiH family protein